jgi:hypothetical protein
VFLLFLFHAVWHIVFEVFCGAAAAAAAAAVQEIKPFITIFLLNGGFGAFLI